MGKARSLKEHLESIRADRVGIVMALEHDIEITEDRVRTMACELYEAKQDLQRLDKILQNYYLDETITDANGQIKFNFGKEGA